MKSLNAKRIAAIAASLAIGLVFGSGVSIGNVPIINSAGQPVVQIVVGSTAQPSDGVVAANIAAVIGNLAFTSTPITATVQGTSGLTCSVTTPKCTLSNQQVWLGERGQVVSGGSYGFKALIGSVLNGGVQNFNTVAYSKALQGGTSSQYSYPQANPQSNPPITSTPTATSPFTGLGALSVNSSVVSTTNGGGLTFSQLSQFANSQNWDNILQLSQAQVPGLLSNSGPFMESEYLWVEGFPVYDQASGVQNFAVLDAAGAYQITFGTPPHLYQNVSQFNSNSVNHAAFTVLGQTWSIFGGAPPTTSLNSGAGPTSTNFITGGSILLAQSQTPLTTVYVGHNLSSGSITVDLQDLSYPNNAGIASASVGVYNNGVLTNQTAVYPGTTQLVNSSGTKVYVYVSQTFPGLYAYQKWAKMQLFNNVVNVTSGGKPFNTNNKQWNALLRWTTNESSPAGAFVPNAELQGITIYSNTTRYVQTLTAGQAITFIQNPTKWKVTFIGDTLGTPGSGNSNYDPLSFTTAPGSATYANPQTSGAVTTGLTAYAWDGHLQEFSSANALVLAQTSVNDTSITEPENLFSVSSSLPTAFTVTSPSAEPSPSSSISSLNYSVDTYQLQASNAVNSLTISQANVANDPGLLVIVTGTGAALGTGNYVSNSHPLTVSITGYKGGTKQSPVTLSFTGAGTQTQAGTLFDNVTNVQLGYAAPGGVSVVVYDSANIVAAPTVTNALRLATLTTAGSYLVYKLPQYSYDMAIPVSGSSTVVLYNGEGTQLPFTYTYAAQGNTVARGQFFTYNVPLITNPQAPTSANAFLYLGGTNSTTVDSSPIYWLNRTNGYQNAWWYVSTQGSSVNATVGFRSERGDQIGSISTASTTLYLAKTIDTLSFVAGPSNSSVGSSVTNFGPYGVGQSTNIANVTIAAVNATCTFSTTSCTVSGIGNLTAVPSVTSAVTPAHLNTATVGGTPLAVLDTQASNTSSLIVIGSRYVNSVARQIFAQNPQLNSTFGPGSTPIVQAFGNKILVAGYSASDTVTAGNQFIQELLSAAGT